MPASVPIRPLPPQVISSMPGVDGGPWSARAVVHPTPLYRIEGEPSRRGDGIYDRMSSVGAHEVLVENLRHDRQLWTASDAEIEQFLLLAAQRIQDLKRDARFKYVSIFKNHGANAGQEFEHPTSQLTATTFVPRRVLYELRAGRDYFKAKERCVFCDIISQELQQNQRVLEVRGDFIALCPYAPRVPYETWILPRTHEAAFERFGLARPGSMRDLGALLRRTLQRIRTVSGRISPRAPHRSQHAPSLEEPGLLENHRRRLSLAHRNSARGRGEGEVLHLQRGVLLAGDFGERGQAAAGRARSKASAIGRRASDLGRQTLDLGLSLTTTRYDDPL